MSDSPASFTQVLAVPQFRRLWVAHVFAPPLPTALAPERTEAPPQP